MILSDTPSQFADQSLAESLARRVLQSAPIVLERMHGGRSNSVWKVVSGENIFVLKLYGPNGENPIFPNDPVQERNALYHYAPLGLAPRLVEAGPEWVLYEYVDGYAWSQDAGLAGEILSRLHAESPLRTARRVASGSVALDIQTRRLAEYMPTGMRSEFYECAPSVSVAEVQKTCGLHGDPVPANIICLTERTLMIDWQCPAVGDPCEDIAIFLSPAMQVTYRGEPLSEEEQSDFWKGYGSEEVRARYEALRPLFHWRMLGYCLWRQVKGCSGSDRAIMLEKTALLAAL